MAINGLDGASTSDATLEPFRDATFDPVDYLNANLPVWSTSTSRQQTSAPASLADLANRTQTLLSQLNGQLTRLSTTLNVLTDEILRSGGRLAYEVEVLQGDTAGLTDVLTNGLRRDIGMFLPSGLSLPHRRSSTMSPIHGNAIEQDDASGTEVEKPEYITRLQTLTHVRARLDEVIQVFHDAMEWEVQPSEMRTSNISVVAPEPAAEVQAREEKGRAFVDHLRNEVTNLSELAADGRGQEAMQPAFRRVEALRELAIVWKGTVEERPRVKFGDSLWKMVQDRS